MHALCRSTGVGGRLAHRGSYRNRASARSVRATAMERDFDIAELITPSTSLSDGASLFVHRRDSRPTACHDRRAARAVLPSLTRCGEIAPPTDTPTPTIRRRHH